jgi:hypothetical protein
VLVFSFLLDIWLRILYNSKAKNSSLTIIAIGAFKKEEKEMSKIEGGAQKMETKKIKVAVIAANNEAATIATAVVIKKERLKERFHLNIDHQVKIINPKEIMGIDLAEFDRLYVIGMSPENMGLSIFEKFVFSNHQKLYFWYSEQFFSNSAKLLLKQAIHKPTKLLVGVNLAKYGSYKTAGGKEKIDLKILELINTLGALRYPKKIVSSRLTEQFRKVIYMAKLNDQHYPAAGETNVNKSLKELLKSMTEEKKSTFISDMLFDFDLLRENHEMAKQTDHNHPILGKTRIIKPAIADVLLDKNLFFSTHLSAGVLAVAIKNLDCDPEGNVFEVCTRKKVAQTIDWETPGIEKISDCRFMATRKFVFLEN